jgi:hypothetical protein
MPRGTMGTIITEVRARIKDTGGSPVFTDDQIQTECDNNVHIATQEAMTALPERAATVQVVQTVISRHRFWEQGVTFVDKDYNLIVADSGFEFEGRWHFGSNIAANIPVYITGRCYDLNAVAANLLDQWAATLKLQYSFTTGGAGVGTSHRSGLSDKYAQVKALADTYRARAGVKTVPNVRTDLVS